MGAILSFFSGSAFRMIWGEVSHFFTAKEEHKQEMEKMRLEGEFAAANHSREMERLRLQSDLGIKELQAQGDLAVRKGDADAFVEAMKDAQKPSGIKLVDLWNGCIRPAFGTVCLVLWMLNLSEQNWVMAAFDLELLGSITGFYFADRALARRGK